MMSFSWPKDWQDWVSLFLGIWLCLSPWILHFTDDEAATNNVVLVGFIMIGAELDFGQKFNGLRSFEAQNKGRVNFFTVTAKPRQ